jgi:23S rRNA (cytidine2498-2'-O)-methyltransferase
MPKYIFTCHEKSEKIAISEYKRALPDFFFLCWLDRGVGLFSCDLQPSELVNKVYDEPLIFTRHLFRVQKELPYQTLTDIKEDILLFSYEHLDITLPFSLQFRTTGGLLEEKDLRTFAGELVKTLIPQGYIHARKTPAQILSAFFVKDTVYLGVGTPFENLSKWNGGMPHFSHDQNALISRAECKLLEALDAFSLSLDSFKTGLDLGAAPGGWSHVLLQHGITVTAVDPAQLAPRLEQEPELTHFKGTTQEYIRKYPKGKTDVLLNDMKMDVDKSVAITKEFSGYLNPGGIGIITFKLPQRFHYTQIKNGLISLSERFQILTARQLFHNRSEITVLFTVKNSDESQSSFSLSGIYCIDST